MASWKRLFRRSLEAAPGRLHLAAHSHHLWPDASLDGHTAAWADAALLADRKWEPLFEQVIPEAQAHIAEELNLPEPSAIAFAANTHDLLIRLVSARSERPLRVLASDGEFHSFRRQAARWVESGAVQLETVPLAPFESFPERLHRAIAETSPHLVLVSHVFFQTGWVLGGLERLAETARNAGAWLVLDSYHAFMAIEADLSAIADCTFYLGGGYKYAMSGEGLGFLYAPQGLATRPEITGWFAEFDALAVGARGVGYAPDWRRFLGATFEPTPFYRFNAVRRMLAAHGLDTAAINRHVAPLRRRLEQAIEAGDAGPLQEAEVLNPAPADGPCARFLALRHSQAQAWRTALAERNVHIDARGDVLRIGLGLYHDPEDIWRFCEAAQSCERT